MSGFDALIFANFGVTDLSLQIVRENVHAVMDLTKTEEKGWFKKPLTMLKSPSKKTVWLDTDCEVRENTDDIFNLIESDQTILERYNFFYSTYTKLSLYNRFKVNFKILIIFKFCTRC